ncbi:hypothetical protein GCM10017687_25150 [Streptomyces echinatus]
MTTATDAFRNARDFLLDHREDYATAYEGFRWPRPEHFNWALDWFDVIADGNDRTALHIVEEDGAETRLSFAELSERSNRVARWLRDRGVAAEDRVLVMLGNQAELWETALAAMKLRAVVIPATPLLGPADLRDRVDRGRVKHVIARAEDTAKFADVPGAYTRISVGGLPEEGWEPYEDAYAAPADFVPDGPTLADDPLMLYFTSGTTARPKLVEHTHTSYPIGHLATMYWIGLRPGDVHLNISSPGWAKHAWSNLFAPWNAGATVFLFNYTRFDASRLMAEMDRAGVTTFCAPPTVWRMLIQADLTRLQSPAPRGRGRRRAAQPRGHRAGPAGLGQDRPGRLRPDRDRRAGLQQPRSAAEDRLHGPPQPRIPGGTPGPGVRRARRHRGRDRPRPRRTPGRPDDRLSRRPRPYGGGHGRRLLPHGGHRDQGRRGLSDLYRPK